jgi:hypothetical protein
MTTDRELKTLILDLMLEVKELRMQVRRMEEANEHRHAMIYEWCAPQGLKDAMARDWTETPPPVDIDDLLKQFRDS